MLHELIARLHQHAERAEGELRADLEAAADALEQPGEEWYGVYFKGKPYAAYPNHTQAEVYVSGFCREGAEIRPLRAKAVQP